MTTTLAIPQDLRLDDTDLKGKTIPELCQEAVGFAGMGVASRVETCRRFLYITGDERWRDPLKYGRDHEDSLFGFSRISGLSARELGDYLGGISMRQAKAYVDAVQVVGLNNLSKFTPRAIECLAQYPEALKRACRQAKDGERVTESMAAEFIQPWVKRSPGRARTPLDDDERTALTKQIAQAQRENRRLQQEVGRLKVENTKAREELRGARAEIADMQKRLYAK